jgi:potassium efflux system protein
MPKSLGQARGLCPRMPCPAIRKGAEWRASDYLVSSFMPKNLGALLLAAFVALLAIPRAEGQAAATTNTPPASAAATNAPAAVAPPVPPAPAPVALADIVTGTVTDSSKLQDMQTALEADQTAADDAGQDISVLAQQIDQQQAKDAPLFQPNTSPALPALRTAQAEWQTLADQVDSAKDTLTKRLSGLEANIAALGDMDKKWRATLQKNSTAPVDLLQRINDVIASVRRTANSALQVQRRILSIQNREAEEETRLSGAMTTLKKARANAVTQLFVRNSVPLWEMGMHPAPAQNAATSNQDSFTQQVVELRTYVAEKFPTTVVNLVVFDILALVLFGVRREVKARSKEEPAIQHAAEVFEVPAAMAALLALLLGVWLYPLAPRLFTAGLGAAALVPTVIILRRLIEPSLFPILYAMVAAYFLDQVRYVAAGQPFVGRSLFLGELLAATLFLVWLLRSKRFSDTERDVMQRAVRLYARVALGFFCVAILANVFGYAHLSFLTGNAILGSGYWAIILYAAVRIVDGLIMGALRIRPFSFLNMVRSHYLVIGRRASRLFRWLAFFFWLWKTLDPFFVRRSLVDSLGAVLTYTVPYAPIPLSLAPILIFGVTIWLTLLVSRFVRFVLAEEVYPKLNLGAGIPYTASTLVHYLILVVGSLFALAAVHIDLSRYAVLAGALGVGLGFGLQNIMNNFVSGIILLFERPIKVGDVIQVDTSVGTVESIGIRASVIRITNGSEIIMPNGNLISNPVTNWTFSNRQRVITIPVAVAAASDPQKVMGLLIDTAKANPMVLKDPPPQALFTSFTGATRNFELRAWTNSQDSWMQVQSNLALAISAALGRENIPMS